MNKFLILTAAVVSMGIGVANAQQIAVRDEASVDVPSSIFSSAPSNELKQEARRKAVDNAWRRYQAQNASGARAVLFAQHGAELRKLVDDLCSFSFYEEVFDKQAGKFSVRVRGSCDQKAVDAAVNRLALSTSGPTASGGGAAKQGFTFVFLARRAADSTTFVDRVTRTATSTVSTTGTELAVDTSNASGSSSSSGSKEGGSVTQSMTSQSKGTIDRRDATYKYKVEQSEGVDNAVTNVLTTAGFDVSKYSDVIGACPGPNLDEVVVNFADPKPNQAELVNADLRKRMMASARGKDKEGKDCEIDPFSFFAVGLLDILKAEQMPDGTQRVTVVLTIDVRDIRKKVPTAVAAIPGKQFQAIGRDRIEAANTALQMAAEQGTREVVDMLRQRGIN